MTTGKYPYKPIIPGFPWDVTLRVKSKNPFFPEGAYRAEVRVNPNSAVITTLTTENGGLIRLDDGRMQVVIAGAGTASIRSETVYFDVIRVDEAEDVHTGLRVHVPVNRTITAAHART